jgi:hypothetical protein
MPAAFAGSVARPDKPAGGAPRLFTTHDLEVYP